MQSCSFAVGGWVKAYVVAIFVFDREEQNNVTMYKNGVCGVVKSGELLWQKAFN
jgi:hypothetical protein